MMQAKLMRVQRKRKKSPINIDRLKAHHYGAPFFCFKQSFLILLQTQNNHFIRDSLRWDTFRRRSIYHDKVLIC